MQGKKWKLFLVLVFSSDQEGKMMYVGCVEARESVIHLHP